MSADTGTNVAAYLKSVYGCSTPNESAAIYDKWAATYDIDIRHAGVDYVAPELAAKAVVAAGGKISGSILDAGCGTGLVGVALAQAGAKSITGIDLSPGMLDVARKTGVYDELSVVDMSKVIDKPDQTYDVVTCVGTLTEGHVGPVPALQELVRVLKRGGLLVSTVLDKIWVPLNFKDEVERLGATGSVDVLTIGGVLM